MTAAVRSIRYRRIRALRIILGVLVLLLFHIALLSVSPRVLPLLHGLTLTQLMPSLVALVGSATLLAAGAVAVLLGLTFLVGRIYCSVLCPLGVLQDLFLLLNGRVRRRRMQAIPPLRRLHYGVLLLSGAALAAGYPIVLNLLEPYALWGRILRDLTIPVAAGLSYAASELLKLVEVYIAPLLWNGDPFVALVTGLFWLLLFTLVWYRGRWFCNALCPTGALLRLPAGRARVQLRVGDELCISCGRCEHSCKAGCISSAGGRYRIDYARCVTCFDCAAVCPTGAISMGWRSGAEAAGAAARLPAGERRSAAGVDRSRRGALARMAGLGGGAVALAVLPGMSWKPVVRKRAWAPDGEPNLPAVPPGAESIRRFSSRCIACHSCVSTCPTHVLQPSLFEYGYGGFMQPVMDYGRGYCEWECVECTQICPTDAIRPLSLARKQEIQIGEVQFLRDRCVVFSEGTACGACAEVCPTQAVFMVPYVAGLTQPAFEKALCVGCGNCEYACPVEGGKAIYVRGKRVHTTRTVKEKRQEGPVEAEPEEFPF